MTALIAPISSYRFMTANTFFHSQMSSAPISCSAAMGQCCPVPRTTHDLFSRQTEGEALNLLMQLRVRNWLELRLPKHRYLNPCLHALNVSDLITHLLGTYDLFAAVKMKLSSPTFVHVYVQQVWVHAWGFGDLFGWCHSGTG